MEKKICRKCDLPKPLISFHKSAKSIGGRCSTCKECQVSAVKVREEQKNIMDAMRKEAKRKDDNRMALSLPAANDGVVLDNLKIIRSHRFVSGDGGYQAYIQHHSLPSQRGISR